MKYWAAALLTTILVGCADTPLVDRRTWVYIDASDTSDRSITSTTEHTTSAPEAPQVVHQPPPQVPPPSQIVVTGKCNQFKMPVFDLEPALIDLNTEEYLEAEAMVPVLAQYIVDMRDYLKYRRDLMKTAYDEHLDSCGK